MSEIDRNLEIALMAASEAKGEAGTKNDETFKVIAKDKFFLAAIMKAVIPEYKDVSERDIATKYIEAETISTTTPVSRNATRIKGLPEEDSTVNEGFVKYDVIFEAKAPLQKEHQKYKHGKAKKILINLLVDVEAQRKYYPGYPIPKRSVFYGARMLSSEFDGTTETIDYNDLYKVYSIWICFDAPDYMANSVYRIKQTKEDLIGSVDIPEYDYNLMESVIILLGKDGVADPKSERILEVLYAFFGRHDSVEKQIKKIKELGFEGQTIKEAEKMFSYSEMIAERNLEKGVTLGKVEEHTNLINSLAFARKMYKEGYTMQEIAKECGIPEGELERVLL